MVVKSKVDCGQRKLDLDALSGTPAGRCPTSGVGTTV